MLSEEELVKLHYKRVVLIGYLVSVSFFIIIARLWYLQIFRGDELYEWSIKNKLRKEIIVAPRGMIYSRNDELLVDNVPRFDAVITPQYLKNRNDTLKKLASVLSMKVKNIESTLKQKTHQAKYRSILIKKNISQKEVAIIETENLKMPGVSVETFISREYLNGKIGAHLLGYISEIQEQQLTRYRKRDNIHYKLGDFIGQFGLEEQMDTYLRGADGYEYLEVDALGRKKRHTNSQVFRNDLLNKKVKPGNNLKLTIDQDMQRIAYKALEGKVGSVIALNIHTGEILTMVSTPSFDPSQFSRGISPEYWEKLIKDDRNPLRNRNIQEHYPPGSTFKVVSAITALDKNIIDKNTEFYCKGKFKAGYRTFHCWKKYGHKKVNLIKALRESCNVYFYEIAKRIDINVLAEYATMLGLGKKTGIFLPLETSGLIPTREWKLKKNGNKWQKGETLSCVIGQSYVLSTPLQIAQLFSLIANGGILYRPYLVKKIFTNSGQTLKTFSPLVKSKVKINKETFQAIQKGLFEVVNHPKGTAYYRRKPGLALAGKTGTSQIMRIDSSNIYDKCDDLPYKEKRHGVFAAYVPYNDPQIALASVIEHGCSGAKAAAPVVIEVAKTYMKKYHLEKYEKIKKQEKKYANKQNSIL